VIYQMIKTSLNFFKATECTELPQNVHYVMLKIIYSNHVCNTVKDKSDDLSALICVLRGFLY